MKICILAAGIGSRSISHGEIHKALLPVGNKAVLTQIIEKFNKPNVEFVIAVGYQANQIKDYISIAHPDIKVSFVNVDNYDKPNSGPGHSLYCCRDALQEPFIFTSCDTILKKTPPSLDSNWMGCEIVDDPENWCSVCIDNINQVKELYYKVPADTKHAFTGVAGIKDFDIFWKSLEAVKDDNKEFQVNAGIEGLIDKGINVIDDLGWYDTGNEANYLKTLKDFEKNYSFEGKITDITYQIDDKIIKFFANPEISRKRYYRGKEYPDIFAKVYDIKGQFYSAAYHRGTLLSENIDYKSCMAFLLWMEKNFWNEVEVNDITFENMCKDFYLTKTLIRLEDFVKKYLKKEENQILINGESCMTAAELLHMIPENFYKEGLPSTFHGDLHNNNIITTNSGYRLIDWRQDFAGDINVGDRYYDLAKFLHVLTLSVETMASGNYSFHLSNEKIEIQHYVSEGSRNAELAFWKFVKDKGYDEKHINIISAITFINMAPLYDENMGTYLYYLGRLLLQMALNT